jgi:ABC-type sugar transport system permease subunit/ABC-type glycerol-3-phosphate transport system substrate-binding protein
MRNLTAILAVVLCVAGLFPIGEFMGQAGAEDAETGEKTVVRFCYWANHVENAFYQEACESFERENPGISIKREWYVGDYGPKLQLVLITGKAADIILMDDEIFPRYSERGYLENLRPYIMRESDEIEKGLARELRYIDVPEAERDPNFDREYLPTALESFNYRGFQGGLPWDGNANLVYYNKDLFDKEGIPYPAKDWTWDDFREIAKKLTKDYDGDGRIDQFGTNIGFGWLGFEPHAWSWGGDILNEDRTKSVIQEPRSVEAAQFIYDMKMKDRSIAWSGEMEGFNAEVQILTGRVGMVPAMSYMIPALNRVPDAMRWDIALMPIGPYGDRYTRVTWDGISIYAHADQEKKEIAWRFIKHIVGDGIQSSIGDRQRGLPIRRKIALEHYVSAETPAQEELALEATMHGRLTPITPRYLELRDAMNAEFALLNIAETLDEDAHVTPAECFARLEPKINAVLAKELADWEAKQAPEETGESPLKALGLALLIVATAFGAAMCFPPARRGFLGQFAAARHMFGSKMGRVEAIEGILFASPWLLGLCFFTGFPIVFSIVLSFCEWDPYEPISAMKFIGAGNFARALSQDKVTGDPLVLKALYNTFYYAFFAVPLGICTSLGLAVLLNQKIRGITIFRTTFYLPSIVSGVATVVLWMYIFNPTFGPLNTFLHSVNNFLDKTVVLSFINLPEPKWLGDPAWGKPAMIIMSLWAAGGSGMLIFLAGLQGVPDQLYEVAELDGAGRFRKFWNVTLPMLTPTIYFNLIMGIIGALKVFMQAFIMTDGLGGADNALLFYVLHLYRKAFIEYEMGYASALAWILFSIILAFTLLVIRSSAVWVYYEGERKR